MVECVVPAIYEAEKSIRETTEVSRKGYVYPKCGALDQYPNTFDRNGSLL